MVSTIPSLLISSFTVCFNSYPFKSTSFFLNSTILISSSISIVVSLDISVILSLVSSFLFSISLVDFVQPNSSTLKISKKLNLSFPLIITLSPLFGNNIFILSHYPFIVKWATSLDSCFKPVV